MKKHRKFIISSVLIFFVWWTIPFIARWVELLSKLYPEVSWEMSVGVIGIITCVILFVFPITFFVFFLND